MKRFLIRTALAAAIATPVSLSASAQNLLEEVIVTAQKREQSATDVPLSITAYNADFLESLGIEEFDRLSAFVPGLVVQEQSPNNPAFVIRGITSDTGSAQRQSRVSVYQDGVDISRSRGSIVELFDVARIEAVKGPQATLFGSAASVGAISVISKKPTDSLEGQVSLGLGNYDQRRFSGVLSGPLMDEMLRARLAVVDKQRNGYINNLDGTSRSQRPGGLVAEDLQGTETFAARLILDSRPMDDLLIEAIVQYQKDTPPGTSFKSAVLAPSGGDTEPYDEAELAPLGARPSEFVGGRLGLKREVESYTLTVTYDLNEDWSLTNINNYREFDSYEIFDADGSWSNLFQAAEDAEGEQWSLELRANYDSGGRWVGFVGASVFDEEGFQRAPAEGDQGVITGVALACILAECTRDEARALLAAPESGELYQAEFTNFGESTSYSVYADATFQWTERFAVTLGGRYVVDEKKSAYAAASDFFLTQVNFGETGNEKIEGDEEDFDAFLPRLILDYDLTQSTMAYLNLGRGHTSELVVVGPDPDATGIAVPDIITTIIPEETVDSAELGFKSVFDDMGLVLAGSVFYQLYNDFQTTIIDDLQTRTVSVDEATMEGVEFEVNWTPTPQWLLFANAAWIEAELESGDVEDPVVNFDGNRFRLQPETSLSAGVRYTFPALSGSIDVGAYWDYRSSVFFEEDNAPKVGIPIKQGAYDLWALQAGYFADSGRYSLRFYIENLEDEEYTIDGGNTGGDLGSPTFIAGSPRFYGGSVTWYF